MDCDSDFPHASDNACNKVLDRFAQHTGTLPPCEAQLLECICWNTYIEAELVAAINAQPPVDLICQDETWEATMILDVAGFNPRLIAFAAPEEPEEPPFCEFEVGESGLVFHFLDTAMTSQCKQELSRLIPIIPGCL